MMSWVDLSILGAYFITMICAGFWFSCHGNSLIHGGIPMYWGK